MGLEQTLPDGKEGKRGKREWGDRLDPKRMGDWYEVDSWLLISGEVVEFGLVTFSSLVGKA